MNRCTVLYLTYAKVATHQHLWALRLRYRPNIIGVVVAHCEGWTHTEYLDWEWDAEPWPRVEVRAA